MKTIYFEIGIDELELDFDYQPYQRETLEQEGISESFTLCSVKFRGIEIIDKLDQSDIEQLTNDRIEDAREAKAESKISAHEDRKNNF